MDQLVSPAARRRVEVESGCFIVGGGKAKPPKPSPGPLVGVTPPHGLLVLTKVHIGTVEVVVEQHEHAPVDDGDTWDEVAEVDIDVTDLASATVGEVVLGIADRMPYSRVTGPHRLRISATGRDYDERTGDFDSPEVYRVQAWPSGPSRPELQQTT